MNNKVIYTALIGAIDNNSYDTLAEPDYKPEGWDFVCFTDVDLQSENWDVRPTLPLYIDNTRTARKHKLLPHRLFPDYEYSIWIDANIKVINDVNELLSYLDGYDYATHDHSQAQLDPWDCIYEEAEAIFRFGEINMKKNPEKGMSNYKDDPELVKRQVEKYRKEGYPEHNGLVAQMSVLRRHNEKSCIKTSEDHWLEMKYNSKREQLSFNYIAWKNKLKFSYIQGDSRDNKYFLNMGAHTGKE